MFILGGMLPLHRADLQQALLKNLPKSCNTHLHKRLVSYQDTPSGPILLLFQDGSTAVCDVLIGADGIKSVVRKTLFANLAKDDRVNQEEATAPNPVWSGTVAYRALIPKEFLEERAPGHRTLTEHVIVSILTVSAALCRLICSFH